MKKYIFIFNSSFEIIISAKNSGSDMNIDFYKILLSLVESKIHIIKNKSLFKINPISLETIQRNLKNELEALLIQRNISVPSSEQTEWKSRFSENEMFQNKKIFGNEYKLFVGGLDNKIYWFASFYELIIECIKNKSNMYILFSDKIIDLKRLQRLLYHLEVVSH
ncbi:hypothetical protein V3Q90_15980 [Flavobacterium oreochromis]|uniref:hypothetical protein n=1 Tax=Flavobacterium oreochromis TaxID=2906078 RepID=UPI001CE6A807|nr:hypothetical protein [Flavobacterium oreochromis]QYS85512.1 hypothetical protein JJC03_09785 [Flavobacterium oreochromis]